MKKKIIIILNSKGGVGKSYLTKLLFLKADKEKLLSYFMDGDNASASISKFFKGIEHKKSPHIYFKSENLLGIDKKIDRTKFDSFLHAIELLDNVVVDFGAASSEQLLYYIQEELHNDILDTFEQLGIRIYLVVAGGGSIKESIEFINELKKIEGIGRYVKIVANEYLGGVNGMTVKEYADADIQITSLHPDANSEAQKEWNDLMNSGVVYSDIEAMTIIRKRRIMSYLNFIFQQFDLVHNELH